MQKISLVLGFLAFACTTSCSRSEPRERVMPLVVATNPRSAGEPTPRPIERSPLGTNLTAFVDWNSQFATIDAFKQSRSWISGSSATWEDNRKIDLDEHGWVRSLLPDQMARTLLFWGEGAIDYPSGDYVVLFRGRGTIEYFVNDNVVSRKPGRHVLRVDAKRGGIGLFITETDPSDPIRDIRVIVPGGACGEDERRSCRVGAECAGGDCVPLEEASASRIFHPRFLESLAPFGVIRFMDWMNTNGSTLEHWKDRPRPDDARWTAKGVPVEVLASLCNLLDADAWVTLPHRADDAFVREFAKVLAKTLEPERHVFVEYSNEVWNGSFVQADYARERGTSERLGGDSPFEAQMRFYSRRSVETFRIFQDVFRDRGRLVRVMASQAGNADVSRMVLSYRDAYRETDVLAVAPYFGGYLGEPEELDRVAGMSLDALMTELGGEALDRARKAMDEQGAMAKKFDVPLVAYEGGQHLVGVGPSTDNAVLNALFDRANRDPRMGDIYLRHLQDWKAANGTLFVHYGHCSNLSKWGRWGALESLTRPSLEAPKYRALTAFAQQVPRWWTRLERSKTVH